jgi:hypothetical protein
MPTVTLMLVELCQAVVGAAARSQIGPCFDAGTVECSEEDLL